MNELSDEQAAGVLEILAERTRATERTAEAFVPPQVGIVQEAKARRHHLIVGRRGVGKSMLLLNVVAEARKEKVLVVYLDIETLRGIPYPDVLIRLLATLADSLIAQLRAEQGWFKGRALRRRIRWLRSELLELLQAPQESTTTLREESAHNATTDLGGGIEGDLKARRTRFRLWGSKQRTRRDSSTIANAAEFRRTKMEGLRAASPDYRHILSDAVQALEGQRALVVMDDFYFIARADQADVLAYLHQITKGLEVWLKVGGVEHRLQPFIEGDPPRGLQPHHDAGLIHLDATLRDFAHTRTLLEGILAEAVKEASVELEDLVTDTGRERLVLASGGVPRDYLSLTAAALRQSSKRSGASNRPRNHINAEDVSEVAPTFLDQKEQELSLDASPADIQRLRDRFNDIVAFCVHEQRRNVFLVEATILREEQWGRDIAALAELRFLHKVANLTVKSSSPRYTGRRYEAFVLDLSAYAGSRVRNIEMIPFWESGGLQKIRGASFVYRPSDSGRRPDDPLAEAERQGIQLAFEELD
jgi:hypothetical protein